MPPALGGKPDLYPYRVRIVGDRDEGVEVEISLRVRGPSWECVSAFAEVIAGKLGLSDIRVCVAEEGGDGGEKRSGN